MTMTRSPLLPLLLLGARADIPPARPELGQHTRRRQHALRRRAQAAQAVPLASNALSLNEFNAIRATEAPQDFGGVDPETADGLWGSAIEFEYEVSNAAAELYPHTMCSSQPDMSGDERGAQMTFALESVRLISSTDWRTSDYLFHNTDSVSCGILMASAETVSAVYEWNGEEMDGIEVNPLLGSMKMVAQTVNVIRARMAGTDLGAVSVSAASGGADAPGGTVPASQLGLRLVLCPGTEGSGEEIVAGLRGGTSDVGSVAIVVKRTRREHCKADHCEGD